MVSFWKFKQLGVKKSCNFVKILTRALNFAFHLSDFWTNFKEALIQRKTSHCIEEKISQDLLEWVSTYSKTDQEEEEGLDSL